MNALLSIIVPVYNVERYLRDCVDSILNQSYRNIKLILVDDGSTDKSGEICNEYASADSRVVVIHQKNGGQSDARDNGLELLFRNGDLSEKSEYVMFVDSDDELVDGILQAGMEALEEKNCDVVCFGFVNILERNRKELNRVYGKAFEVSGHEAAERMMRCDGLDSNPWAKIYKQSLFDGIRYPVGKIYEDVIVTYKVLLKAEHVVNIGQYGYIYRQRSDSTTGRAYRKNDLNYIENATIMLEDIRANYPELESAAMTLYSTAVLTLVGRTSSSVDISKDDLDYIKTTLVGNWNEVYKNATWKQKIEIVLFRYNMRSFASFLKKTYRIVRGRN